MITNAGDADEILDELYSLGCSRRFMRKAERLLYSGSRNIGLTYTKVWHKTTVLVVSEATKISEFLNSFAHEIDHAEKHISRALDFSPYSEKASYLVGEIVREMFNNSIKKLRC